jgi:hypothetical protein
VTDGSTLFRVGHTLADRRSGELFVELENCRTLELVVCALRGLGDMSLRRVKPSAAELKRAARA